MQHIYIAGPMRGIPAFNFPAFNRCEDHLRERYPRSHIFNPAARDTALGYEFSHCTGDEDLAALGFDLPAAMRDDLAYIINEATDMVMLPGWQRSTGATHEKATADLIGVRVWYWYPSTVHGAMLTATPTYHPVA